MPKQQDKQRELEMFNVPREDSYDQHDDLFHHTIEARMDIHAQPLLSGRHRVLEAGCGTGAFSRHFIKRLQGRAVWDTIGVDIAPAMVDWNNRHPQDFFTSRVGDLENADLFPAETFDLVLCPMVLHHFPDPRLALRNIAHWLRPGGYLYILEPNGSSPVHRLSKFIRRSLEVIVGKEYTKRFATVNETDHSMRSYWHWLSDLGLEFRHKETILLLAPDRPVGIINWVRYFMYKAVAPLGQPCVGNIIIVLAQKCEVKKDPA